MALAVRPISTAVARRLALVPGSLSPSPSFRSCIRSSLIGPKSPLQSHRGGRIRPIADKASTPEFSVSAGESSSPSTSLPSSASPTAQLGASGAHPIDLYSLGSVVRNGKEDGVVRLDVGGKEFRTLRSTVAVNPVLSHLVACAESRSDLVRDGKEAVFVDRDPAHFGLILRHLRNKADGVSPVAKANNSLWLATKIGVSGTHVQLPKDKSKISEIFAEAVYFDLKELKDTACKESVLVWVFSKIGSTSDPFHAVTNLVTTLRRGAVAIAGLAAGASTMQSRDAIIGLIPDELKPALVPFLVAKKESSPKTEGVEGLETA